MTDGLNSNEADPCRPAPDGVNVWFTGKFIYSSVSAISPDHINTVRIELTYYQADPYAVHAVFSYNPEEEPIKWVFARDTLVQGLFGAAGTGDVQVRPVGSVIELKLSSDVVAVIALPRQAIEAFLTESTSDDLVPLGSEGLYSLRAVDIFLAQMFPSGV